jgi:hypothetical protein
VAAVAWFRRWLGASGPLVTEGLDQPLPETALRCTATGQVATAFKDEVGLADLHLAEARRLARQRPAGSPETLAAMVSRQLGLPNQLSRLAIAVDQRDSLRLPSGLTLHNLLLRRPGEPPLPARLLLPQRVATRLVLWLPGQGVAAVLRDSAARLATYQRQGTAVLLADLRGLGETTDPAAFNDPKYYNQEYRDAMLALHASRPLLAQRVADVGTLLHFLRYDAYYQSHKADHWPQLPLLLRADGPAALVALHAAVVSPQTLAGLTSPSLPISQVQVGGGPPSFQYYLENPAAKDAYSDVLPGVLRSYDVPDLRHALGTRLIP